MNIIENYKIKLILFYLCFLLSFILSIFSEIFLKKNENSKFVQNYSKIFFVIINLISRYIYGFSGGRLITRKYLLLYLPESKIKYYSLIYFIIIYFGMIFGVIINFISKNKSSFTTGFLNFEKHNYLSLFCIGLIISLFKILIILCFFTEPTKESMIKQNRVTISTKDETSKDSLKSEKNIFKDEDNNEKIIEQINARIKKRSLLFRSYNIESNNKTFKKEFNGNIYPNSFKEIEYKTYNDNNRLNINKIDSGEPSIVNDYNDYIFNKNDDLIDSPLNISLLKRDSNNDSNNINHLKAINTINTNKTKKKNKKKNKITNNIDDDLMSVEELKGLNSIEKNIIDMNTNNNFNDVNLLPEELDRIRKNQYRNNKSYLCIFLTFILSLLLTNSLNEYILLSIPLCFLNINNNKCTVKENELILSFTILKIFSFPFIIFFRIMKMFVIERRLLLILYLILYFFIIGFSTCIYFLYDKFDDDIYSSKNLLYCLGILVIFILGNLIESTTHLLSDKLIPSFVKICHINNRYLISYSSVIGKILGALIFCGLFIIDNINKIKNTMKYLSKKQIISN